LHAGSLVAALASWLDARAHAGRWLVRIEDLDRQRCQPGTDQVILRQLAACGLHSDGPVLYQSARTALYQQALDQLILDSLAYPCACSRQQITQALQRLGQTRPHGTEPVYPGTCRNGLKGRTARVWRFKAEGRIQWRDRRLGPQQQDVATEVGDFVLRRAGGDFAYQLAVVVDDAAQGVTDVVRGHDLADNTARQMVLQRALHLPTPRYLHTPLVLGPHGEKLSKPNGAPAIDTDRPLAALVSAASHLGLSPHPGPAPTALIHWAQEWAQLSQNVYAIAANGYHAPALQRIQT